MIKHTENTITFEGYELQNLGKTDSQRYCQRYYWTVEIEGLNWTRERKIWNFESAKAVFNLEKRLADAAGRGIDMFYTVPTEQKE